MARTVQISVFSKKFGVLFVCIVVTRAAEPTLNCRERSNHLRQDGGLCFEIPPWQLKPVEVEKHLDRIRNTLGNTFERRQTIQPRLSLVNRDINRYVDTVIAPFLDTYHINIQNSYQQLTNKIVKKTKDEINAALKKKQTIYEEFFNLADQLKLPGSKRADTATDAMCNEERRAARTLASKHISLIYRCTEQARTSIAKMAKYAEEMISITRRHMENALAEVAKKIENPGLDMVQKSNVTECLKDLSRAAVSLGYELDLSLANARRHNEQSCEKLANCSYKAKKSTEEAAKALRQYFYQCVYA